MVQLAQERRGGHRDGDPGAAAHQPEDRRVQQPGGRHQRGGNAPGAIGGTGRNGTGTTGAAGTAPGGGGGGARATTTTDRAGGTGAAGQAWVDFMPPGAMLLLGVG